MIFDILLTLFLVLLNAFFVAAEFAIVKVRYSQIQIKALTGNKVAKSAQSIINKLDTYLSATQLGITFASLGLGWIGEPVVAKSLTRILPMLGINLPVETIHQIALPVGFILITVLHIVFGELAPKSIAIRKAEATTMFIALPLKLFFIIFRPFIWLMNSISNGFLKLIGIQPAGEHDIHSTEELQLLVKQSKEGGKMEEEDYQIIKNAFDFTDHSARQVMLPRQHVYFVDIESTTNDIVDKILDSGYSRVPVCQKSMDNIIGIAYTKEVLKKYLKNPQFDIREILHPVLYVIETKRISDILREFQKKHLHFAVIIDEFGGTEGIITLEDILEELVGEIQDEDDEEKSIVEKTNDNTYVVQAAQPLVDINERLPHPFTLSDDYSTLSGLLLFHLDEMPRNNQVVTIDNYEIRITGITRRMVQVVQLTDLKYISTQVEPPIEEH